MTATKRTSTGIAAGAAVVLLIGVAAFGIGRYGGFAPALPGGAAAVSDTAGADGGRARAAGARDVDKLQWAALAPAQQAALQPLQAEWNRMDGPRKAKWLELAKRFNAMKPEEQQRVHERMRAWVRLTPEQRELARETYMRTRKIAPEQKNATWKNYQDLPEDQKRKLAASGAGRKPALDTDKPGPAPIRNVAACPAGMVRNTLSATPPCVAAPAPVAPPAPPAQPATPPVAPPPPVQQEKPVPANWGITPNNA